ncbi:MAG: Sugar transferases involved in lipopolysaccharide synthesis [Roseibaca calidilacus]|uniref:Sugar transferases involved in lipopolysaccharide synthesis n=1 Tax=Roseibaca calidilacus TaxID=1666912 RepID=A0A0P7WVL0_9RHOB|nr:exopolysaccharide biosynthesis polyprenyl glycosylphosphotransferase [Roseibaca calidilacus]KPP91704.1 MAG: Sugar transferases involved in lipopolysaccharide synthesis [Roseibaca calidilacus]CUX82658.1 Undecaprenyl-phosphate glucose phosphotransferase [Roseibaca calidilacus]
MQQLPSGSLGLGAQPLGGVRWRLSPARAVEIARFLEWVFALAGLGLVAMSFGLAALPVLAAAPSLVLGLSGLWLGMLLTRPDSAAPLAGYDRVDGARLWAVLALLAGAGWWAFHMPGCALWAVAAAMAALWRTMLVPLFRVGTWHGRISLRIVIAGGGEEARATLEHLSRLHGQGVRVLGLFDDRDGARSPQMQMGVPRLGRMADLPDFIARQSVDMVIVTMPPRAEDRIVQILAPLWVLPVDIRLAPHDSKLGLRPRSYRWLGGLALLDLFDRPLRGRDALFKRGFDLVLGGVLMVVALPLMALIALAIRLDSPGPILFRQLREGYVGAPFTALKFRSLHHALRDDSARNPVARNDARVTRVGRFLRRTSLDELPQLFNVLAGDMSLVGPRPHAVGARSHDLDFAAVAAGYAARHKVKPGLTGLAQIRGFRGAVTRPEDIRRRLASDLDYIDTWSPWLDMRILVLTLPAVLSGENAY